MKKFLYGTIKRATGFALAGLMIISTVTPAFAYDDVVLVDEVIVDTDTVVTADDLYASDLLVTDDVSGIDESEEDIVVCESEDTDIISEDIVTDVDDIIIEENAKDLQIDITEEVTVSENGTLSENVITDFEDDIKISEEIFEPENNKFSATNEISGFIKKDFSVNVGDEVDAFRNAGEETYTFTSSNISVVTIENGKFKAVAKGNATIKAVGDRETFQATVKVFDPEITGPDIIYNDMKSVAYKVINGNGATQWSVSDETLAIIDKNGKVTGLKGGSLIITAVNNEKTITKEVNIYRVPGFSQKNYYINDGESLSDAFDDAGIPGVTYESNNTKYVTVDENGKITGIAKGSAKITAVAGDKKYVATVYVSAPELTGKDAILINNKTETLKVINGYGSTIWSSSDPGVVTVDNKGKIKAISKGSAVITAINNGREMSKVVYTYNVPKFENKQYVTNLDAPITVALTKDDDLTDVVYSVNDTRVATIDEYGLVTPVKTGTVTVFAKALGVTYKTTVKIFDPVLKGSDIVYINGKNVSYSIKGGNGATVWSVSDESKASIDTKGRFRGLSEGSVLLTAVNNGRIITKEITIYRVPSFGQKNYYINNGDTVDTIFDDAGIPDVTYTSNNTKYVTVDEYGTITGIAKGSAKITALADNKKYTVTVNVSAPELTGKDTILINNKTETLKVVNGRSTTIWSSSDPNVIVVDNKGKIKAISKGSAIITAINNGREMSKVVYTYNVPKFENKQYVTNLDVPITVALTKDDDLTDVVYSVNDTRIATIDEHGLVTPVKTGSVTVSAKALGVTYKTKVKIFDPFINGKDRVDIGKTIGFSIKNGNGATVWSVDDETVAAIDNKGKVKGLDNGRVTVTAVNNGRTITKNIIVGNGIKAEPIPEPTPIPDPTPTPTPIPEEPSKPEIDPVPESPTPAPAPENPDPVTPLEDPEPEEPIPAPEIPPKATTSYTESLNIEDIDFCDVYEQTGCITYRTDPEYRVDPYVCYADSRAYGVDKTMMKELKREVKKVVAELIDPGMSDLEKYYVLGKWTDQHVKYDASLLTTSKGKGQTAYEAMILGKSVCAGEAKLYALLCHQAGLACTINVTSNHMNCIIPNINGQAVRWDYGTFYELSEAECLERGIKYTGKLRFTDTRGVGDYDWDNHKSIYKTFEKWIKDNADGIDDTGDGSRYIERGSGINGMRMSKYDLDMDIYDYGLSK